jgi:hypothetical protein
MTCFLQIVSLALKHFVALWFRPEKPTFAVFEPESKHNGLSTYEMFVSRMFRRDDCSAHSGTRRVRPQ